MLENLKKNVIHTKNSYINLIFHIKHSFTIKCKIELNWLRDIILELGQTRHVASSRVNLFYIDLFISCMICNSFTKIMYKHSCTVSFNYNLLLFLEVCVDLLMILLNVLRLNRMSISTSKV